MAKTKKTDPDPIEKEETIPEAEETVSETPAQDDRAAEMEKKLAEQKDQYLRLAAEYDNYRKRTQKEKEQIYPDAFVACTQQFLPVLDNLERAVKEESTDANYKKGVEMILKQFYDALEKSGITEIEALGKTFDPELHAAVMHVDDDKLGENEVCEVLQKGFIMGDRVIRHAVVKVAN